MKIAIDWSHTKDLTTFDGKKVRSETLKQLLKRISKDGSDGESIFSVQSTHTLQPAEQEMAVDGESKWAFQSTCRIQPSTAEEGLGEESTPYIKSNNSFHSPSLILEQGCPLALLYNLILSGAQVFTIDNHATEEYRKAHGIEKSDENDARIIYELANNGAKLSLVSLDNKLVQMHDIYHQYCRYQKARVAMQNMKKGHERSYKGTGESKVHVQSIFHLHPAPDLSPYDIAISVLEAREKSLLTRLETIAKGLPLFEMAGGESTVGIQSTRYFHPPAIKGLGQRLWWGIIITANPANFPKLSAYLRFCGLTGEAIKSHKYNRHARMLYRLLAEETMRLRDQKFRQIYDQCKADIAERHPDYTKGHIHNAALNRTATMLAKNIYSLVGVKNGFTRM